MSNDCNEIGMAGLGAAHGSAMALSMRGKALRDIKSVHTRWYHRGEITAEEAASEMEAIAVSVWQRSGGETERDFMTDGNVNEAAGILTAEAQPGSGAASGSAAMRASERILSGVDCGAVRYHGPRADGQWCWQYRSASQIAAIIEEEMGKPPNDKLTDAGPSGCD